MTDSLASLRRRAGAEVEKARASLEAVPEGSTSGLSPETWVELVRRPGVIVYQGLTPTLEEAARALVDASARTEAAYNRLALARLVQEADFGNCPLRLPPSMVALCHDQLRRILAQLGEHDDDFYSLSNDDFLKDLSIVTWKLLPAGSIVVERFPRVPLRFLLRRGPRQLLRGVWFLAVRMQGLGPVLLGHEHGLLMKRLDEDAWLLTHHRIADLLAANPGFRAIAGESWQIDPQLERISPHLACVRRLTVENGGATFFTGRDTDSDRLATLKSRTRRRLWEEGRYRPEVHMRIWPRGALIEWSARTREAEWGPVGADSRVPATFDQ